MKSIQIIIVTLLFFATSCGIFRVSQSRDVINLDGSKWVAQELGGESISPDVAMDPDSFSILFGEDGNLGGKGVCNRIMGRYEALKGGNIKIENVGATLMFCPNLEKESEYIKALEAAVRYSFDGDKEVLYLYDSSDNVVVSFKIME